MGRVIPPFVKRSFLFTLILVAPPVVFLSVYSFKYSGKIYPNTIVAGQNIGGLNTDSATSALSQKLSPPGLITISAPNQDYKINTKDFGLAFDFSGSAARAFNLTRTGNFFYDFYRRVLLLKKPTEMGVMLTVDESKLDKIISIISGQNSVDTITPSVSLAGEKINIQKGTKGVEVDSQLLRSRIGERLSLVSGGEIETPLKPVGAELSDTQAETLRSRVQKYVGKQITLRSGAIEYIIKDIEIVKILDVFDGLNYEEINSHIEKVSKKVNTPPQNPKFNFENGKVTEFLPAKDGLNVKTTELRDVISKSLKDLSASSEKDINVEIPVVKTPPTVTTEKVNNLGIKELLARGTSTYFHSIPSRVHNITLAASRINGTLVAPGETFSFNETLGDVSQFTGYQQAYVISGGKTILGDGGGVCQVSTTLFRTLLNAGLPIIERSPHSYRVGYYEQNSPPGLDATVYGPSPDLKFTNDTLAYILIEANPDPKNYSLVFELYGTSDGRTSEISKPSVTNIVPAPEDKYENDPTLPAGVVKQVDFRASGARVVFNYKVTRGGQEIFNKVFVSNYRPWQAVYLRGTGSAL